MVLFFHVHVLLYLTLIRFSVNNSYILLKSMFISLSWPLEVMNLKLVFYCTKEGKYFKIWCPVWRM